MPETLLDQPEASALGWGDLLYAVHDPAGAPSDCKITKENLLAAVLKALSELTPAAGQMPRFTGPAAVELVDATAAGLALLGAANSAAQRAALGLEIGTNVQAYDAELAALASLTSAADKLPYFTGAGTAALATLSSSVRTLLDAPSEDVFRGRVHAMQRLVWSDASADTTVGDGVGVNMTTTGGNRTVTLSDPTSFANSNALNGVRLEATAAGNTCTVAANAGWTIDGASALVLRFPGEFVVLNPVSSGNRWRILVDGRIHAPTPLVAASDVTAQPNRVYTVDASAASRTVTLPATPATSDYVGVVSCFAQGSNTITVDCNGNSIQGTVANLTLTTLGEYILLQWDATRSRWEAVSDGRLVSTGRPGHVPPLPADATKFFDGSGAWSTPGGGAADSRTFAAVESKSAGFTAAGGKLYLLTIGSNYTAALPAAASCPGETIGFKVVAVSDNSKKATLDGDSSETIDGAATLDLFLAGDYVELASDGANWQLVVDGRIPHAAQMRNASAQGVTSGSWNLAVFDTVLGDPAGLCDLTNDKFVVRRTGRYRIVLRTLLPDIATTGNIDTRIDTNAVTRDINQEGGMGAGAYTTARSVWEGEVSAGHDVQGYILQGTGATKNTETTLENCTYFALSEIR